MISTTNRGGYLSSALRSSPAIKAVEGLVMMLMMMTSICWPLCPMQGEMLRGLWIKQNNLFKE